MELGLKDKVIAIIGGTSGIGAELAVAFAQEGCIVSVCGRSQKKISELEERFSSLKLQFYPSVVDVRETNQLKAYITQVGEKFEKVDVLINNAAITIRKPFEQFSEVEFYDLVDTNFKSIYFASAYVAEQMRKNGNGGVIINTSSFTSVIPTAGVALYSSLKAAVDKLTAVLSAELAADNIRVVSVQPGMTITPMTKENCEKNYDRFISLIPMKRLAIPADIIGAYLFLASGKASYINGVSLPVTGAKLAVQNPHYCYEKINVTDKS